MAAHHWFSILTRRGARRTPHPYFLELAKDARERQLEQALIDDIQRFLLELGTGFAFYGRQRSLLVGERVADAAGRRDGQWAIARVRRLRPRESVSIHHAPIAAR